MELKDVYVVYHTEREQILSVHATELNARTKQHDLVTDELARIQRSRTLHSDDTSKAIMHYAITDLDTALSWLASATYQNNL